MKEKKRQSITQHPYFFGFVAIVFLLLSVAVVGPLVFSAYADRNEVIDSQIQIKNAAITQAIINRDYQAWDALVNDPKLKATINQANFAQFAEAYTLLQTGRLEEADVYKKSLGLKEEQGTSAEKSIAITRALQNKDYNLWAQLVGPQKASQVSADRFSDYAISALMLESGFVAKSSKYQAKTGFKRPLTPVSSSHE